MVPAAGPTELDQPRARSGRAAPLSAPERRAAIVAATIPLLCEHGPSVSTRQIAEAAGVAEGTLFSVFPDKDAVVVEAVEAALDPAPTAARLAQLGPELALEERLAVAVEIVQSYLARVRRLLPALGPDRFARGHQGRGRPAARLHADALERLFEPDRARLRRDPAAAARALLALTLAGSHPMVEGEPLMPASEIVSLLLDGIRAPSSSPSRSSHRPPTDESNPRP